jgi:hypothetical protein
LGHCDFEIRPDVMWASSIGFAMPQASLSALLVAYRHQIDWLLAHAAEFESGSRRVMGKVGGQEVDLSPNLAAEYRHKAGNLEAVLLAYERLHAKGA